MFTNKDAISNTVLVQFEQYDSVKKIVLDEMTDEEHGVLENADVKCFTVRYDNQECFDIAKERFASQVEYQVLGYGA